MSKKDLYFLVVQHVKFKLWVIKIVQATTALDVLEMKII